MFHQQTELFKKQHFLSGLGFVILGVMLIFYDLNFAQGLFMLLGLFLAFDNVLQLFRRIKTRQKANWLGFILMTWMSLVLMTNSIVPASWLAWFMVINFLLIGVIIGINYLIWQRNRVAGRFGVLFDAVLHLWLGIYALNHLGDMSQTIYRLFGFYLLGLGFKHLAYSRSQPSQMSKTRQKHLGVPVLFSALLPVSMLKSVNDFLSTKDNQPVSAFSKKNDQEVDLQVWIHTARKGFEMMGHVDISYKGVTYAYGQYDVDKAFLGGMLGDGTLFTLGTEEYLESLAQEDWRAVFGYGLSLTEEQQALVERKIAELMQGTTSFELTTETQRASYLGQLAERYKVATYKFTTSKFKTYFVMTTNCVLLADTILGEIGIDSLDVHGIITPGIYLDYFERAYQRGDTQVVSKFVLGKKEE